MPIYEYIAKSSGCSRCQGGFELIRTLSEPPLTNCPDCGAALRKLISPPSVGRSVSCLDDRAKNAGFTKLKRLGKGEYEKVY